MTASTMSRTLLVLGLGILAGAGVTYLVLTPRRALTPQSPVAVQSAPAKPEGAFVRLSPDAVTRAGIILTTVEAASIGGAVTIPALVEPNAYKQTVVTALIAGRVTRVLAELGQRVRRGQTLAELYSPELAEAQRMYISTSAALHAHEQSLARIDKLVAIGSASQQELEMAHAEHAALTTSLEGARSRLELLGLTTQQVTGLSSASQMAATTEIRAPLDGVITARQANVGANVDGTTPLFTVVDLSTVWVVGDLYEHDFSKVSIGRPVTVTASAFPDLALHGMVSYIDPQLNRDTRTAKVRVEVQNGSGQLRLGMYAQMRIDLIGEKTVPVVPKAAVQTIGGHSVVYVSDPNTPGLFIEREIQTGAESRDRIAIVSGVAVGESVVSAGSFSLRAERERLGQSADTAPPSTDPVPPVRQTASVIASDKGFEPARLTLKSGTPAVITFTRTTDATCAKEVVFPSLNIRRELPLNTAVAIEFTPSRGEVAFVCGMGMFKGTVSVE